MLRNRLSIDLPEERLVMHINGHSGAVVFGKHNLRDKYDDIIQMMGELENLKSNNEVLSPSFSNTVERVGVELYNQIIAYDRDNPVQKLFSSYVPSNLKSPSDVLDYSVSFMMNQKYFGLPIELMRDWGNAPVATRIPVYRTITTRSTYTRRRELIDRTKNVKKKRDKIKVLLMCSNTHLSNGDPIIAGGKPTRSDIYLHSMRELDEASEIRDISNIIEMAKDRYDIQADIVPPENLDYDTFLQMLSPKNSYDIIHYTGHGYYDSQLPGSTDSCIYLWGNKERSKRVAVRRGELSQLLEKQNDLKLAYFSCCQGARFDEAPPTKKNNFMGLLDAIALAGVPNVIGMRWPISPQHANDLAQSFYKALFLCDDHNSIEAALVSARASTLSYIDQSVWCSPVLVKQDL